MNRLLISAIMFAMMAVVFNCTNVCAYVQKAEDGQKRGEKTVVFVEIIRVPQELRIGPNDAPKEAFKKIECIMSRCNRNQGLRLWVLDYPEESWVELLPLIEASNKFATFPFCGDKLVEDEEKYGQCLPEQAFILIINR